MGLRADATRMLDAVLGRPLCRLLPPSREAGGSAAPPRRVLVIRPGGIGDAVLFVPMLRHLRESWPAARIDLLCERRNRGVVAGTGLVDRLYCYDRPRELLAVLRGGYDLVIDTEQMHALSALVAWATGAPRRVGFATNSRRRMLTDTVPYDLDLYEVRSFLELARAATGRTPSWDPDAPFYPVAPAAAARAREWLAGLPRPRVAVHPGASIPQRRWPPSRYAEVARRLAGEGVAIVVLGGPADGRAARRIARELGGLPHVNLAGRCTLGEAAAVVAEVDVYVSADTGVLHLAYGVGTRTVHLFGPGVLSKWGPPGRRFRVVRADGVPCSPCTRYGYTPPCAQGLACMDRITPGMVLGAVREQLAAAREEGG